MTAHEHSKVWENATKRLREAADAATKDGNYAESVALLNMAALTGSVAAAYQDNATVFKAK